MVLSIDFTWHQSESHIFIRATLKGFKVTDMSIQVYNDFFKLSAPPRFLELFLSHPVKHEEAKMTFQDHVLHIELPKREEGLEWATINQEDLDKATKNAKREEAVQGIASYEQSVVEKRRNRKFEDERRALRLRMDVEALERDQLESKKEEEKEEAERETYEVLRKLEMEWSDRSRVEKREEDDDDDDDDDDEEEEDLGDDLGDDDLVRELLAEQEEQEKQEEQEEQEEQEVRYIPPPRTSSTTKVSFSSRYFPTPLRESKMREEEDWLAKHRGYLHMHGQLKHYLPKDYDPVSSSEGDPLWLKTRGDELFEAKDFASALSAFQSAAAMEARSLGLVAYPNVPTSIVVEEIPNLSFLLPLLGNLAATYIALSRFEEALAQLSFALSFLLLSDCSLTDDPGSTTVLGKAGEMRMKFLFRRCVVRAALGQESESESAELTLTELNTKDPFDKDVNLLRTLFSSHNDMLDSLFSDLARYKRFYVANGWKKAGDRHVLASQASTVTEEEVKADLTRSAIDCYNRALEIEGNLLPVLINSARCYLMVGDWLEAKEHAKGALALLRKPLKESSEMVDFDILRELGILPDASATKRRIWAVKSLQMKAEAHKGIGEIEEAKAEVLAGMDLLPTFHSLKGESSVMIVEDIEKMEKKLLGGKNQQDMKGMNAVLASLLALYRELLQES